MQEPVLREIEGVDLDFSLLPRTDESDVAVRKHRLDLKATLARHHYGKGLRGRYHASHRMNRKLPHDSIDWCRHDLQPRSPLHLYHVLRSAGVFPSAFTSSFI